MVMANDIVRWSCYGSSIIRNGKLLGRFMWLDGHIEWLQTVPAAAISCEVISTKYKFDAISI